MTDDAVYIYKHSSIYHARGDRRSHTVCGKWVVRRNDWTGRDDFFNEWSEVARRVAIKSLRPCRNCYPTGDPPNALCDYCGGENSRAFVSTICGEFAGVFCSNDCLASAAIEFGRNEERKISAAQSWASETDESAFDYE